jgi:hypothetical protein
MRKFWVALALAGAGFGATGTAEAEPVKIAIIETLSGGQAAVGKMFLTAINYGLIKLNDEKAFPEGHLIAGDFYFFRLREFDSAQRQYEAGIKAFPNLFVIQQ